MLQDYKDYFTHNPHGYWFKAKLYGWGWTPVTWQGWLIIAAFIGVIFWNFHRIDSSSHSASDTLINIIPQTAALVAILIYICYKTGEKPRWQWGPKNKK